MGTVPRRKSSFREARVIEIKRRRLAKLTARSETTRLPKSPHREVARLLDDQRLHTCGSRRFTPGDLAFHRHRRSLANGSHLRRNRWRHDRVLPRQRSLRQHGVAPHYHPSTTKNLLTGRGIGGWKRIGKRESRRSQNRQEVFGRTGRSWSVFETTVQCVTASKLNGSREEGRKIHHARK